MRSAFLFLVALMCTAVSAQTAQTARGYFNELRDANAFKHYGDEYVCFPDEDKGGFAIIAKTKDIEEMVAANNKGVKPKPLGDALVVQPYFKGVPSGQPGIFDKADKDSDLQWNLEFKSPMHGKMVYLINWTTGRYRLQVYALDHSKTFPASEVSGKCELIHPWPAPPQTSNQ